MAKHVISTLSADNRYANFKTQPGVNTMVKSVTVKGGAGVVAPGSGPRGRALLGVTTEVTDEEAEFLANHEHFKFHYERGHVKIVDKPLDPEKVATKMQKDVGGAPKTSDDVAADAAAAAKKSGSKDVAPVSVNTGSMK